MKRFTTSSFRSILIFSLFFSMPLWSAQTILLKDGTSLKGEVTGQNEKAITVRTADGGVRTISKRSILKVIYKEVNEDEAKRIRQEEETKIREAKSAEEKKRIEEEAVVINPPVKTSGTRSRWSLVWRSAVLPGWGHYKAERKKTAIVYGALFWTGAVATGLAAKQIESKKAAYDEASLYGQASGNLLFGEAYVGDKRAAYKKSIQDYQSVAAGTALIYLIQLTHAYFTGVEWEKEEIAVTPDGLIRTKGLQLDSMREVNPLNAGSGNAFGWRAEARYNWFF
ncbi:LA_0442/LA_0875 N-terminal domain-containing protein [Leptospira sanjuanensis]|uniref:LA_0442/LA_0875 N-terminal domain-containing protein n=1 Tax=Leptospira sanjuanensis TaxID=2879643 RepID=UPI00387372E9